MALGINNNSRYTHFGESGSIVFGLLRQYHEVRLSIYAHFEIKCLGRTYVAYGADEFGSGQLVYGTLVDLFFSRYQLVLEAKGDAGGGRYIVTGDNTLRDMLNGYFVSQLILYG